MSTITMTDSGTVCSPLGVSAKLDHIRRTKDAEGLDTLIQQLGSGSAFLEAIFIKRTDGARRVMRCRPVTDEQTRLDMGLVTVWDVEAGGYRSLPVEGMLSLRWV